VSVSAPFVALPLSFEFGDRLGETICQAQCVHDLSPFLLLAAVCCCAPFFSLLSCSPCLLLLSCVTHPICCVAVMGRCSLVIFCLVPF
jgi:hypothetical protein